VRMDVVAIDLQRLTLHWVIGTKDEGAPRLSGSLSPGLIPAEFHERTVAVFNGGFQFRHGRWGVVAHGVELQALKPDGCVVVLGNRASDASGSEADRPTLAVALGPGSKWIGREAEFQALRQTPPCLLEDGEVHPWLLAGRTRPWAGQNADLKTRRRSALGIDKEGRTLFYAVGVETEAIDLARGMKAAGAVSALELDINWYWTRFLLPALDTDARYRVTQTLIEGMEFGKNEYFTQPSERDFFYLLR
jgi:hypothetical protein